MKETKLIEKEMVDTRSFILSCNKFNTSIAITVANCEACDYHGGIFEIGRPNYDESGQVIDRSDVKVKASEMDLKLLPEGKMRAYSVVCSRPRPVGVVVLGMIQHNMEVK